VVVVVGVRIRGPQWLQNDIMTMVVVVVVVVVVAHSPP